MCMCVYVCVCVRMCVCICVYKLHILLYYNIKYTYYISHTWQVEI